MVKPFLHQITLEKISVFGFDKKEWSAALLKEIDADQLPVQYGGTMSKVNLIVNLKILMQTVIIFFDFN